MRRFVGFDCEGDTCVATLDPAAGPIGIVLVSGGVEPRAGAAGWQARLAAALAVHGHPVLRFDRRGVGDSGGADPGWARSDFDLRAAVACLRREQPHCRRLVGIGNCDAASALALWGTAAGLDALVLLNPWLVEPVGDLPPAPALRRHYLARLLSPRAWGRLLAGRLDLSRALAGLSAAGRPTSIDLAGRIADGLMQGALPARLILAERDATAIACVAAWRGPRFAALTARLRAERIATASHSFNGEGDGEKLLAAVLRAIAALIPPT